MNLTQYEYSNKVLGCWLGKNIGGTVGAPFEWRRQVNDVSFYVQKDLNGQAMPNDDLDIQLLWLCAMEEMGIDVNSHRLGEYFSMYVTPHWNEYGTGKINMRQGLQPPLSGTFRNVFKDSCGSFIRSEIWACIAPGLPQVAARYAYEDAVIDHGNGEGTYAEIFMAALESAAFVISDLRELIQIGLSYVPADCGVTKAVHTATECFDKGMTWLEARDEMLRLHRGRSTEWGGRYNISAEDAAKGFTEGPLGYDVPSNIGLTLIGLLYGGDDFGKVECTAVNCGEDTDCTAATAGSVWGIIHGAGAVPQKWIEPIGRGIKTVCLNLGDLGYFGSQLPATVDNLTDRTIRIGRRVLAKNGVKLATENSANETRAESLKATDEGRSIWGGVNGPRYDFDFFSVHVDYGSDGPVIRNGQPKMVTVTIQNRYKAQGNLSLHWYLPEAGWQVSPSADGYALCLPWPSEKTLKFDYQFTAEHVTRSTNRAVLEITIEGRPTAMLVPLTLINGNLLQ